MCIPHPQTNSSIAFATILCDTFTYLHARPYKQSWVHIGFHFVDDNSDDLLYLHTKGKRLDHCIILPQVMTDGQY